MQLIGTILLLVILILIGVTVGGGILVLVAYGLGWLLNHVMHFDPFQATLLSLAGMLAFGFLASRIFQTILDTISPSHVTRRTMKMTMKTKAKQSLKWKQWTKSQSSIQAFRAGASH